ncbi:MAG TPA: class I SAM-dependent methyltransferase, partial [Candidatus Hydrogenedentes bacterium]|nr:class I SAM-dependent methyltransferase [Candidatus Hydrogenedentota bacterium]
MHLFWEPVVWPLFDLLKPRRILEIGAEEGKHTLKILPWCQRFGAVLHVIEPFPKFNVEECAARYRGHFELIQGFSPEALPSLPPVDIALIDGDHNWYTVHAELETLAKQNRHHNAIPPLFLLHDVDWPYGRRDLYYDPDRIPAEYRKPWRRAGILPGCVALAEKGGCNANYCNAETEGGERNGVRTAAEDFVAEHADEAWRLIVLPFFSGLGILVCDQHLKKVPELNAWLESLPDEQRADLWIRAIEGERTRVLVELEKRRHDIAYLKQKREDAETALARERESFRELTNRHEILKQERDRLQSERDRLQSERDRLRAEILNQIPVLVDAARLMERREELLRQIRVSINLFELAAKSYAKFLASWRWRVGNRLARWAAYFRGGNTGQPTAVIRVKDAIRRHGKWKENYAAREKSLVPAREVTALLTSPEQWSKRGKNLSDRLRAEVAALENELRQVLSLYERMHLESRRLTASKRWRLGSLIIGQFHRLRLPEVPSPIPPLLNVHWAAFQALRKGLRNTPLTPLRINKDHFAAGRRQPDPPASSAYSVPARSAEPRRPDPVARLLQFTPPRPRNPFYTIMTDQLARWEWPVRFTVKWDEAEAWARERHALPPVVHLHQLDPFYHVAGGDLNAVRERAESLLRRLEALRGAGAALVHTFHNPWPHNRAFLEVDRWFTERAMPLMDRIIVLCEAGVPHVRQFAPAEKIVHIPHPHFMGIYGPPEDRAASRRKFGFADSDFVFCQVGEIKPYKGLERLLDAWAVVRREDP